MKKNHTFILLTAALLVLQSCGSKEKDSLKTMADDVIPVKVIPLQKSGVGQEISVSGQFSTDDETLLSFKTGGIISRIFVREGDRIRKGQLLATLDLTEIKGLVSQAKLAYEKAQRDLQRVSNLYKDGYATLEQYQNVQTGLDVAAQQYETAKFNLKYSEIHALADGYVLRRLASQGQLVSSGTPVFQTNGAGKSAWILKAGVSDVEWNAIEIGDRAVIEADVLDGQATGKVIRKSEGTDPYNGSFSVEIELTGKAPVRLASGMFGKASVFPADKTSSWVIPYEALMDGNAGEGFVFVTNDGRTAHKVEVKISSLEKNKVVIEKGLENYDRLIVSGSAYLTDNSRISIK